MYHKLGRPKRTVKAELISIQEPGCDPVYYRFDNRGSLIQTYPMNHFVQKSKILDNSDINNRKSSLVLFSDNFQAFYQNEVDSNDKKSYNKETSKRDDDIKCEDLIDINYYLNKKPFPSLLDFDPDPLSISHIQPLLVS